MNFNHYSGDAAQVAAALINTPTPFTPDRLEPVLRRYNITRYRLTRTESAELERWTARLAACFGDQEVEARCHAINLLMSEAASRPRISLHDGSPPHLHYGSPEGGQLAHLRAITVAGLAYVVCFGGPDRLGRCHRDGCELVFVDTSRNGQRGYCSARCGNNAAVARHRERRRAGAG